jgi:hypothetical protein
VTSTAAPSSCARPTATPRPTPTRSSRCSSSSSRWRRRQRRRRRAHLASATACGRTHPPEDAEPGRRPRLRYVPDRGLRALHQGPGRVEPPCTPSDAKPTFKRQARRGQHAALQGSARHRAEHRREAVTPDQRRRALMMKIAVKLAFDERGRLAAAELARAGERHPAPRAARPAAAVRLGRHLPAGDRRDLVRLPEHAGARPRRLRRARGGPRGRAHRPRRARAPRGRRGLRRRPPAPADLAHRRGPAHHPLGARRARGSTTASSATASGAAGSATTPRPASA